MIAAFADFPPPHDMGKNSPVAEFATVLLSGRAVDLALSAAALAARRWPYSHGLTLTIGSFRFRLPGWFPRLACRAHK